MKLRVLAPFGLTLALAACGPVKTPDPEPSAQPTLETRADSIAARVIAESGGEAALAALAYLRFDFAFESNGVRRSARRHLWNRMTDDYRIEYDQGPDTTVVVLFNTRTQSGHAYYMGQPIVEESALVAQAYRGFINDMFWLMAPIKMLDPGVNRTLVADSSDANTDVIHLTYGPVGLTPGDQYWMWVDRASGMVRRWAYVLQGNPTAAPRAWEWQEYTALPTPAGPVRLSARKQGPTSALLTDALDAPETLTSDWFTDPQPRLN